MREEGRGERERENSYILNRNIDTEFPNYF